MAGIESGIATILTYADDNRHGYELRCRNIDYGIDCAGLGMLYAAAVEGVSFYDLPDMHSWDIADKLRARGWQVIAFSENKKKRGDILARVDPSGGTGHVVIYLGGGRIVGAEGDWDGRPGDSSGREITERSYYSYGYKYIIRPPEGAGKVSIDKATNGVYRLYNPNELAHNHHWTTSHAEAESLAALGWSYEGVAGRAADGGEQVYRLYNPWSGEHLPTADTTEVAELACAGWVVEGHAWVAPTSGTPWHRLRNPSAEGGDHMLTTSDEERAALEAAGWEYEGVAFCSA